jgi:hypothetical protein
MQIVATSEDGGHPCCQFCDFVVTFVLQFHNSPLNSSVNILAALGGGWPRWQPLNIAVAMPYWRDVSRRVPWQAATATAAYNKIRGKAASALRIAMGHVGWELGSSKGGGGGKTS